MLDLTAAALDDNSSPAGGGKRLKSLVFWRPTEKPKHCAAGADYVARNPVYREIYDLYVVLEEKRSARPSACAAVSPASVPFPVSWNTSLERSARCSWFQRMSGEGCWNT